MCILKVTINKSECHFKYKPQELLNDPQPGNLVSCKRHHSKNALKLYWRVPY